MKQLCYRQIKECVEYVRSDYGIKKNRSGVSKKEREGKQSRGGKRKGDEKQERKLEVAPSLVVGKERRTSNGNSF